MNYSKDSWMSKKERDAVERAISEASSVSKMIYSARSVISAAIHRATDTSTRNATWHIIVPWQVDLATETNSALEEIFDQTEFPM